MIKNMIMKKRQMQSAFTLLEVALIVAIIGMMLMIIVGYLFAPKDKGPLPPYVPPPLMESPSSTPVPVPTPVPAPTPATAAMPKPAPAAVATPAATPAVQTIDLSTPQQVPAFR